MICVQRLDPTAKLPTRAYLSDLGLDLYALNDVVLFPNGEPQVIRTGVAVELPPGWGALVLERSSQGMVGVTSLGQVIDPGYRGELHVILINLGDERYTIRAGDRVAQLVPLPRLDDGVVERVELTVGERGARGFGSTGR